MRFIFGKKVDFENIGFCTYSYDRITNMDQVLKTGKNIVSIFDPRAPFLKQYTKLSRNNATQWYPLAPFRFEQIPASLTALYAGGIPQYSYPDPVTAIYAEVPVPSQMIALRYGDLTSGAKGSRRLNDIPNVLQKEGSTIRIAETGTTLFRLSPDQNVVTRTSVTQVTTYGTRETELAAKTSVTLNGLPTTHGHIALGCPVGAGTTAVQDFAGGTQNISMDIYDSHGWTGALADTSELHYYTIIGQAVVELVAEEYTQTGNVWARVQQPEVHQPYFM